jgi:hypothetical protein
MPIIIRVSRPTWLILRRSGRPIGDVAGSRPLAGRCRRNPFFGFLPSAVPGRGHQRALEGPEAPASARTAANSKTVVPHRPLQRIWLQTAEREPRFFAAPRKCAQDALSAAQVACAHPVALAPADGCNGTFAAWSGGGCLNALRQAARCVWPARPAVSYSRRCTDRDGVRAGLSET